METPVTEDTPITCPRCEGRGVFVDMFPVPEDVLSPRILLQPRQQRITSTGRPYVEGRDCVKCHGMGFRMGTEAMARMGAPGDWY